MCTACLIVRNAEIRPRSVFVCFVYIAQLITVFSLYSSNLLVLVVLRSVSSVVRTEFLCVM